MKKLLHWEKVRGRELIEKRKEIAKCLWQLVGKKTIWTTGDQEHVGNGHGKSEQKKKKIVGKGLRGT